MIRNIIILTILLALSFGTVTDIDGNIYQTVQIGPKTWMAENLRVTHYSNGDEIPTGFSDSLWADLNSSQTGAYAVYPADDDEASQTTCGENCADVYGNLYNWYAVDDERDICPEGWYLPSDDEYKLLEMHLGMSESDADTTHWRGTDEGGKLKEEDTEHWCGFDPSGCINEGATNESGFTALPGGSRSSYSGGYFNMSGGGYYWTSSTNFSNDAWYRLIHYNKSEVARLAVSKRSGQSVRCIAYESETGTIHVPQEFLSIQAAIDVVSDGDTILVSAGTYYEYINFDGKDIIIQGEDRETTIIDGSQDYSNVVVDFSNGESFAAVLSGFTISNGYSSWGGGIRCYDNSSPTLKNLTITNNSSLQSGGGIAIWQNSNPTLNDIIISGNSALNSGGGMYISHSDPILEHVIISGNTSEIWGGGIFINDSSNPVLNHVTISGNSADNYGGGGIKCMDNANPSLINCILWNNSPQEVDFINYTNTDPNSITIAYSDVQGGEDAIITNGMNTVNWLYGNIDMDPLFVDSENGDYNLTNLSPCIDAGDPENENDQDGTIADMGALYYHQDQDVYGCTDSDACNYNPAANVENGSCKYPECSGECYGEVTISNQWSDGYHYDFTYTLRELTDYEGQLLEQIAQKEITSLIVTCQETGQIWLFDSNRIAGGNGNHDFSFLHERYEDFPLPTRDISNGVLIGIDTYATGNYHSLWFSVTAIDDEGNEFTHDNYVDPNPYGWNLSNEITFPGLYFTGVIDYANLDVLYAEGSFPTAGITYQIEGGGYSEGFACDETCEGSLSGSDCENSIAIELHEGSNLMSFSLLPEDSSIGNVLSGDNISAIAGEGEAAINTGMGWVGSLTTLLYENGYWLLTDETGTLNLTGIPIESDQLYFLHVGNNLISYSMPDCGSIDEVLPDDVEDCIYAIAGEGVATINTEFGWVGSLTELCPDEGYWFVNQCDEIEFIFNEPISLARREVLSSSPYPYNQSPQQAFYFIESVENIEIGDWILAYNGDIVIGARQWQGSIIDVPAMGSDGSEYTIGYIEAGTTPEFKVLKGGKLIELEGYVPSWSDNDFLIVSSLAEALILPESFSLDRAYPNPFNPMTTMSFALPKESNVLLEVYDINGRIISKLIDNNMKAGYHSVVWNADSYSSGVYFVKMQAGDFLKTQKLLLVK